MMTLDFSLPSSWSDLNDAQLKFVFKLLADEYSLDQIKVFCLFRWNGTSVVSCLSDGSYLLRIKNKNISDKTRDVIAVSPLQIAELFSFLEWLGNLPDYPVRVSKIGSFRALPANFQGVPFEKFLMADNLYQGYLEALSHNDKAKADDLLEMLFDVLYSSKAPDWFLKIKPWHLVNCFYWFTALKAFFSSKFPDFFQPATSDNNKHFSVEDAMNAQIRALTKGDVTKEKEILALDTWRALAELNAQAREYRELNNKFNKK